MRGGTALLVAGALALGLTAPGIARADPVLEPSAAAALDQAFDSNVYNGRGFDIVTRLTPRLTLVVRDRRIEARIAYTLGLWWYLLGKAGSTVNQRLEATMLARLTRRLELRVAAELVRAQDPGFLVRAGVVAPQTGILDLLVSGGLSYRLTRRLDALLEYQFRDTTFDQQQPPNPPLHDSFEHDVIGALAIRASRRHDVRLGGRFQYFSADSAGLATTFGPSLGWRWQLRPDVELRAEGGPLYYDALRREPIDGAAPPRSEWTGRGSAVLRWYTREWRAALSYTHDLVSGTGAATVLWADYITAQFGYKSVDGIDVYAALGAFTNGDAPNGPRLYVGVTADAVADVRVQPWLRVGGYYSFRWQESDRAPLVSIVRHIVGVRLTAVIGAEAQPPRRIREVHP